MLFWIIGSLESRSSADLWIGSIDYGWPDSRQCRGEVVGYVSGISWHGLRMHGSGTSRRGSLVTSMTRRPAIDSRMYGPRERFSAAVIPSPPGRGVGGEGAPVVVNVTWSLSKWKHKAICVTVRRSFTNRLGDWGMSFIRDVLIGILANSIWHHRQLLMFRGGCALAAIAGWILIASDRLIEKGGCLLLS